MRRPQEIELDVRAMSTMVELTSIFEGIASVRIAQIKNQVQQAQQFFNELWNIYRQLRSDEFFRFGRQSEQISNKELLIIITAEGSFSGDIDQKLVSWMLKGFDPAKQEIIVVGHHGAVQLAQRSVSFKKYFKLPQEDQNINVAPLVKEVQQYASTTVYYQTYVSLSVQDVRRIGLGKAVQQRSQQAGKADEIISEKTYIFEPSTFAVVDHLERSMTQIALSQLILESKLAQYASRFQAMSSAHSKADQSYRQQKVLYNRSHRAHKDEHLKEVINGLRKAMAT